MNNGGPDTELSAVCPHVYDSLQEETTTTNTYANIRRSGRLHNSNTNDNSAHFPGNTRGGATTGEVQLSRSMVCVVAVSGILLLCTLCSIITGVVVYAVVSAKFEQDSERSLQNRQRLNDSVVSNGNKTTELEQKLIRLNDEWKEQLRSLRNNYTNEREHDIGDAKALANQIEALQNNYTTLYGEIDQMDGKLDHIGNVAQALQKKVNSSEQQVAFLAHTPTGNLVDDTPIFKMIELNVGGGYNITTGNIHCPVSGIYSMSTTLFANSARTGESALECYVMDNKRDVAAVDTFTGRYDSASTSFFIHLSVGDIVDMKCLRWNNVHPTIHVSFTGTLIDMD